MKQIILAKYFIHITIPESASDVELFCYPGSLAILAKFLLMSFASTKRSGDQVPLILFAPDSHSPDSAIGIGIPPLAEESVKSFFGNAFTQTARKLRRKLINDGRMRPTDPEDVEHDLTNVSVVRLPYNVTEEFIETLNDVLDN